MTHDSTGHSPPSRPTDTSVRRYDAAAVARLDRRYSAPQMAAQRRRVREIIGARLGEAGVDVGCGAGHLACELAQDVAPGGRIIAIDKSPDSVDATRTRVAREGLDGVVETRIGEAASLPVPDESLDFVVGTQVYCYVADIAGAIREAARALRKGGRVVLLDSDWDMCTWESADPSLTRRMLAARGMRFAHAHLPRQLHRILRAAGLTLSDAQVLPLIETRFDPESFGAEIIHSTVEAALAHGMPAAEVAAWERDLRSRTEEGEWFFCLNRFIFTARKLN